MNKKKRKILQTRLDGHKWVEIGYKKCIGNRITNNELNYYKGQSGISLKFFLIIILFCFFRFSEAHNINPKYAQPSKTQLLENLSNFGFDSDSVSENQNVHKPNLYTSDGSSFNGRTSQLLNKRVGYNDYSSSDSESEGPTTSYRRFEKLSPEAKSVFSSGTNRKLNDQVSENKSQTDETRPYRKRLYKRSERTNSRRPYRSQENGIPTPFSSGYPNKSQNKTSSPPPGVTQNPTLSTNEVNSSEQDGNEWSKQGLLEPKPKDEEKPSTSGNANTSNGSRTTPVNTSQQTNTNLNKSKAQDVESVEEESEPPQNVFKTDKVMNPDYMKKNIPNDKGTTVTPDDDFDLQEVERVNSSKFDPHISQKVDDEWLRRQRQSQMIGSQIPVATSFEYNKSAHVLEPKFESPKVLGGIIQTLTDRESKLRRMEKRKLKIQHDLNLYVSKESAYVVNMLNNGEVSKLQKVHPLVFMRLQEVLQTQYALDSLVKKDGDKVRRFDKSWYLNSPPTEKASFIEEIRKYSRDPELYGKFKKPSKISESRENIYKKLELFHNDYICQRVVRENQYAAKVLRSLEQQSGLYLAPFYHNVVPGLGNLWMMKNFEKYFMDAVKSKTTTFGKVAPTLVGRFMLMVENGTVLPSTPSSQVAIHSLTVMLALIMDGVKEPKTFLGKSKYYGFMSLCNPKCAERIFDDYDKKNSSSKKQVEFLKWVFTFHTDDLLLIDTSAQKIVLNNMYAITREDIFRSSPRNIQLRIQSEFSQGRSRRPSVSLLELSEGDELENEDEDDEGSMMELESEANYKPEKKLSEENRRLLKEHGEKKREEYRKMQFQKILEQQRKEVERQREEKENEVFQRAMRERERIMRLAEQQAKGLKVDDEVQEKPLFVKEQENPTDKELKKQEREDREMLKKKNFYESAQNKLEALGSSYKLFLDRFMTGYHPPGKGVDPVATADSIVPFHVFVPSNKPTGGYDNQFLDVVQTVTDLVNLAYKNNNVYYQSLNTLTMIRTLHMSLRSFEVPNSFNKVVKSQTIGSLFRWLNMDSNRYLPYVPKKYLPFASLSLQLVFFFQEVVENYSLMINKSIKSFFYKIIKLELGRTFMRPRNFRTLNEVFEPHVVYDNNKYRASLDTLREVVDLFKASFVTKPSIPSPIIQYISIFMGLWSQADSDTFNLSERGVHKARKMFFLSFLSNEKSLAEMATKMILSNCNGLPMLHLGCIARISAVNRDCKQISLKLKKKVILHVMRVIESTSLDPLDVIRVASDTCRRCAANLKVRPIVGAPVLSLLEQSGDSSSDSDESLKSFNGNDEQSSSDDGNHTESPKSPSDPNNPNSNGKLETPVNKKDKWYSVFTKNPFDKKLTPEEEEMLLPHFTDRLMLHSELTQRAHCYLTQKKLLHKLMNSLRSAKDEVDARKIVTNVFAEFRTIEVIQSGMGSSIHRLICPFMMDALDSIRIPTQVNIIRYAVNRLASKTTLNLNFKDLFQGLKNKVELLVPVPEGFNLLPDLPGCVFVGSRKYNGVYFSGGYAPFSKIDKPTNILLKPGEGRLVYDGDNFVSELQALQDVSGLEAINVVHERDFDRYVYQMKGEKVPVMLTERQFALDQPNFIVRAHVLVTARALIKMGFDMGRIIWCGDRYGWVADFVMDEVVPISDVPVYNGQYWLLTSQLSVKDVVGNIPVRFMNDRFRNPNVTVTVEDENGILNKPVGDINIEIRARGKKVGDIRPHGSGVEEGVESSGEENDNIEFLVGSGGDSMSATPGAVKSVRSATFNPASNNLTLDLDMPDFVFSH